MLEQRLDFTGKSEELAIPIVIKRLDSQPVAGGEQPPGLAVPKHEGKHAAKALQLLRAPLFVAVDQGFGVGMVCDELVSGGFQFRPHQGVVEDFAVIDDDDRAVFIKHRLDARGDVHDCQPAMAEIGVFVMEESIGVGSPMRDGTGHTFQYAPDSGVGFHQDEPGNATHDTSVSNKLDGETVRQSYQLI